jgi:type II secretory pathway predicted ATPase ExeA
VCELISGNKENNHNQEHSVRDEVMQHFGLTIPLNQAGYFETQHLQELIRGIRAAIDKNRLVAISGIVGCGKTDLMHRLQRTLEEGKQVTVSRSMAVEKQRVKIDMLIAALFYDLSKGKRVVIPKGEQRERDLQELVKKSKRPIVLFIDEAHDLSNQTLTELKRLQELVHAGGGKLSVVMAGHPKLGKDLRRPAMEEIGYRTDVFSLDGIAGSQREYIYWLLTTCAQQTDASTILTEEAIDLLASKLRTPLQVQLHLTLALEAAYQVGSKPVSEAVVESVLSRQIDDLEPTLARNGYRVKDLVTLCGFKASEVRALFNNTLEVTRAAEIRDRMLAAGLPI